MQTRSQTKKMLQNLKLDLNLDFDYASKCWRENKKYIGNGCFKYVKKSASKNK